MHCLIVVHWDTLIIVLAPIPMMMETNTLTNRYKVKERLVYNMSKKIKNKITILLFLCGLGAIFFYINYPLEPTIINMTLMPNDKIVIALGKDIYTQNCASCHGANLEGQPNWRQRDDTGYLPAPPHDETGHTWHHSDAYLFKVTKYGLEELIGEKYPNKMPAYAKLLKDEEIIAALSYIKSIWPKNIQLKHDQINLR